MNIPVAFDIDLPIFPQQRVPRRKSSHPGKQCRVVAGGAVGQVIGQRGEVEFRAERVGGQKRLDLRGEKKRPIVGVNVIERFHAETITRDEQLLRAPIPDGERKHAPEVVDAAVAILLVQMQDRLRVGARREYVAPRLKAGSMIGVVVDLPIEDDLKRSVLVGHGLMARSHIDDAEAAMRETDRAFDEKARVVRTTVPQDIPHADEDRLVHIVATSAGEGDTANAAHVCNAPSGPAIPSRPAHHPQRARALRQKPQNAFRPLTTIRPTAGGGRTLIPAEASDRSRAPLLSLKLKRTQADVLQLSQDPKREIVVP